MKNALVIALLAGCSGGGFKNPTNRAAEEVLLVGEDIVLRREHDNTITLIATRQLGDTIGTGAIRLRAPDLAGAARTPHLRLARARAFQTIAMTLEGDHAASYEAALLGSKEVGEQYGLPNSIDETGMAINISELQRK